VRSFSDVVRKPPRAFSCRSREVRDCVRLQHASALACLMPPTSAMTTSNSRVAASGAPDIRVSTADDGGWVVTIDRAGRTVATERYSDWHRVERRVAILNLTIGAEAAARVAAMWCAAAVPLAVLGT
jgi:hypothetical protein